MAKLVPYLNFSGKCKEAMTFYKEVFGGDLDIMLAKDTPAAQGMPPEMHDMVMHSSLTAGDLVINASDMMREQPSEGNTYRLALHGDSEAEIRILYAKLSDGGKVIDGLQETFWGVFGTLQDRFGKLWMCNYTKAPAK